MKPKLGCGRSSEILTEDIVRWWKEYFEDLLKPTHMSSIEEAQFGDEGNDSSTTGGKVTEAWPPWWQGPWDGPCST